MYDDRDDGVMFEVIDSTSGLNNNQSECIFVTFSNLWSKCSLYSSKAQTALVLALHDYSMHTATIYWLCYRQFMFDDGICFSIILYKIILILRSNNIIRLKLWQNVK